MYQLRKEYPIRVIFVGWPGIHVSDYTEQQEVRRLLLDEDCIPVFPSVAEFGLYLEFCTTFLWPACNNVLRSFQGDNPVPFNQEQWAAYQVVNQKYADVVVSNVREPSDMIWVHDYHLFLTPMHITRKLRKANIGFFLHSPFPSSEIFRCLPVREEILKGMLCADLIGFHFWEYARHFLTCCRRLLGLEFEFKRGGLIGVDYCSRDVRVRVGHTCLQFDFTMQLIRNPEVAIESEKISDKFRNRFVFGAIDRCDRLSGLRLKLMAYQLFLRRNPRFVDKVVLIQYVYFAALSSVNDRDRIVDDLTLLASEIQQEFGKDTIELFIGEIEHCKKFALLKQSDAYVDTSLKDGLNLIPFEYCAARLCGVEDVGGSAMIAAGSSSSFGSGGSGSALPVGVMIISEFTGCSRVLVGAIKVNPWNTERVVESFVYALDMSLNDKRRHFGPDAHYVSSHSLLQWAQDFLLDVRQSRKRDEMVYVSFGFGAKSRLLGIDQNFGRLEIRDVVCAYKESNRRLFLLDNEGTLAPDLRELVREHGASAAVHEAERLHDQGAPPTESVLHCLSILCADPKNTVVITSGRQRGLLEAWFGTVPNIGYAAEHGFTYKVPNFSPNWRTILPPDCESTVDMSWTAIAFQLMELYRQRVQNTYIHYKGSAMVWQYREADPELGAWQARELSAALEETLSTHHVVVSSGKGYVEVKVRGVNKGVLAKTILDEMQSLIGRPDFVLCIGDDRSDELMFEAVNEEMKPELQAAEDLGPPTPDVCRARSGKSFSDLSLYTPGMDVRRLPSSPPAVSGPGLKKSPSTSMGAVKGDDALGAMESGRSYRRCGSTGSVPPVFTCTVGKKPSKAKYYVDNVDEVSDLLTQLTSNHHK